MNLTQSFSVVIICASLFKFIILLISCGLYGWWSGNSKNFSMVKPKSVKDWANLQLLAMPLNAVML